MDLVSREGKEKYQEIPKFVTQALSDGAARLMEKSEK